MTMPKKEENTKNVNVLSASGLSGKTLTGLQYWVQGNVVVFEVTHSTGTVFLKSRGLEGEVGGTADWGSGTKI